MARVPPQASRRASKAVAIFDGGLLHAEHKRSRNGCSDARKHSVQVLPLYKRLEQVNIGDMETDLIRNNWD